MAERTQPFHSEFDEGTYGGASEAASRVREQVEQFVEGFDIESVILKIEEFGKENPMGLALGAVALGFTVGFLMRNSRRLPNI